MSGEARDVPEEDRTGVLLGMTSYLIWGAMPLYFLALAPAGAWEIFADRILFSLLLCGVVLALTGRLRSALVSLRDPRLLAGVTLAGTLVAANWVIYLLAVTMGRVTEGALGYFLNPLVSVALGLLVLRERLRPLQGIAVAIGAAGALYLSVAAGGPSWVAFGVALTFGLYGLVKKKLGVSLPALEGLTAETLVLAPVAVGVLVVLGVAGGTTIGSQGVGHALMLASTGAMTSVPLVLFAEATRRLSLVTVGLLQFLAPVLQFISGMALGEQMSASRWTGFGIVWVALLVLIADSIRAQHGQRAVRRLARAASATPVEGA